jgi:hypothetical protein
VFTSNLNLQIDSGALIKFLPIDKAPASNIVLKNVTITAENPFGVFFAQNVRMEDCTILTKEGKNKLEVTHAQVFVDGKEIK